MFTVTSKPKLFLLFVSESRHALDDTNMLRNGMLRCYLYTYTYVYVYVMIYTHTCIYIYTFIHMREFSYYYIFSFLLQSHYCIIHFCFYRFHQLILCFKLPAHFFGEVDPDKTGHVDFPDFLRLGDGCCLEGSGDIFRLLKTQLLNLY